MRRDYEEDVAPGAERVMPLQETLRFRLLVLEPARGNVVRDQSAVRR